MNKESWKSVKEVSLVTAAGTAEGAIIGFSVGGPGGAIVLGGIGAATAVTAEVIGRLKKKDLKVTHKVTLAFKDTEKDQRHIITSKVKEAAQQVPLIKVPDTLLMLHARAFDRATGSIKKWQVETHTEDHLSGGDLRSFAHSVQVAQK